MADFSLELHLLPLPPFSISPPESVHNRQARNWRFFARTAEATCIGVLYETCKCSRLSCCIEKSKRTIDVPAPVKYRMRKPPKFLPNSGKRSSAAILRQVKSDMDFEERNPQMYRRTIFFAGCFEILFLTRGVCCANGFALCRQKQA